MRALKAIGAALFALACMLATAALIGASWKAGGDAGGGGAVRDVRNPAFA